MKIYLQANKIFIASKAIDFRRSIDGLCAIIAEERENPAEGVYVFYNRTQNRVKIIGRHNNGFMLIYKRLDKGKFFIEQRDEKIRINRQQLDWLLLGVDWQLLTEKECKYNTYL